MGNKNKYKRVPKWQKQKDRKTISASIPRDKGVFTSKRSTTEVECAANTGKSTVTSNECTNEQPEKNRRDENDQPTCSASNASIEIDDYFLIEAMREEESVNSVTGKRIIDVNYFISQLQDKARHDSLSDCNTGNLQLISEKRVGLVSVFKFECNICKYTCQVKSDDSETENVNLNIAATTGIVASGIGYSQFEELFSAMDVPVFSTNYYSKIQDKVYESCEQSAIKSMQDAAEEEKRLAVLEGRTKNGIPVIDVMVDASWCARSYGSNYKASSGTAAIIGRKTGKILYLAVRNKYCLVCARAQNKNTPVGNHKCYKNFDGSSCSMEGEIIAEGFRQSIPMYGIIYKRMIADGDASTYSKVLKADPYKEHNVTVEKIECRNHILRNLCKKIRNLVTETKYPLIHRKTLTVVRMKSIRKAIVRSIVHHNKNPRDGAITVLHNDIINSVNHAYGDHRMCHDYNCDKEKTFQDGMKSIKNSLFEFRINSIISYVGGKSRSLIENVNTNRVECFNNVIAKFIGGKRINFALKRGYQGRCSAAVLKFNENSSITLVQKNLCPKNQLKPGLAQVVEKRRENVQKRKNSSERPRPAKKFKKLEDCKSKQKQNDYGPASNEPDMSPSEFEVAKEEFLKNLETLTADKDSIERNTILQKESSEWLEIRKNLITASNFGPICKRKLSTDTAPLVKNILYKTNLGNVASVAFGIENEQQALQKMQKQENVCIEPCGLFIDKQFSFIGATPDGLIGDDTLVEVKCPFSASKIGLDKAIEENKIQILKFDKKTRTVSINKKSNWFFQIQGQLHVTGRRQCLLGIWAGDKEAVHIEKIERDDDFWKTQMETKLLVFYNTCLLPEIVNPRYTRGMPIRNITLEQYLTKSDNKENDENVTQNVPVLDADKEPTSPVGTSKHKGTSEHENNHGRLRQLNFSEF